MAFSRLPLPKRSCFTLCSCSVTEHRDGREGARSLTYEFVHRSRSTRRLFRNVARHSQHVWLEPVAVSVASDQLRHRRVFAAALRLQTDSGGAGRSPATN